MRQDYRLEAIALHEIGPFDDLRIEFKPRPNGTNGSAHKAEVHLFTGPNGCGKSTLLYAMADIFERQPVPGLIASRVRNNKSHMAYSFNGLEVSPNRPVIGGILTPDEISRYQDSARQFKIGSPVSVGFKLAVFSYSGQRTLENSDLVAIRPIVNSPFEKALSFNQTVRPQVLTQWIANNRTQAALAKAEGDAADGEKYDRALARICGLIRDICDLDIEFRLRREPLSVTISLAGDDIHFDGLPDGLKSIISWVADLSLRLEGIPWATDADPFEQPIILLLDEIDIHLHPKWQRRVLPAVQKLLPNAQIFASTHSPFVIGSVEDAWVYPLPEPGTHSGPLVVEGIPSGAGKSYRLILAEVFGVDGEFDIETEQLFVSFYHAREKFIQSPESAEPILNIAGQVAKRGEESAQIIDRELRQLSRITGQELHLA